MEILAHNMAKKIALQMNYDEDKQAVITYGLTAIFQMTTIFAVISTIGIIFDFWYECIIIFFGVGTIRKFTGGAHAQTMYGCNIISILSILLLSALSRYVLIIPINIFTNLGISVFVFILCFIICYIRVPVDSPNKPIVKPEKIRRLRRMSYIILTTYFIISILFIILTIWNNRFYSISLSIRMAMLWQAFTLTKIGSLALGKVDSLFQQ